ncbi:hypothetical protein Moror_15276 [Moniliophthora roreri MCA 2997]|uniref:Uncharacterized protein n=1 Tax=Moniliophthora roreri (strain MCA 2997) TaxID=1381753 RepID=V2Y863_MONRO|nr:hypothetical protein Moror_15276 [Moniliophthora roreri MCA 2997]
MFKQLLTYSVKLVDVSCKRIVTEYHIYMQGLLNWMQYQHLFGRHTLASTLRLYLRWTIVTMTWKALSMILNLILSLSLNINLKPNWLHSDLNSKP